jgi:serine/threonine protein kinase
MPPQDDLSDNAGIAPTLSMDAAETTETVIGRYHLVRRLGEGGMGEVWLAEQKEPVRRRVALKLIKQGLNTREAIARFDSERQALALMDHPAIAKVFDADATPQGAPYFVMEYVAGVPITDYCDNHRLSTRERLELFTQVCEGVQHAHQKAIIHRDLKPSNILVTEVDGKPVPKIIDFGVAKALTQKLSEETMFTRAGALVGTPEYMSPEQASSAGEDIDTRTDVYSLGIIFYELLAGSAPIDLRKVALEEFLRRLREEDPPKPSTKISRHDSATSTDVARKRQTDPRALAKQLRGELDSIAMKALEKERSRRYSSASDFEAEIKRYLNNEPVLAVPPSVAYRARKFARRHRAGLATAVAFALVLIAAAAISIRQSIRANREAAASKRVVDFMTNMFKVSNPSEAKGNSVTAREILDKASNDIETGLAKDPELQARMMHTMGTVYLGLGLNSKAESLFSRAAEIRRAVLGPSNRDTLNSSSQLAFVLREESRFPEAEKLTRETLDLRRRAFGPKDHDTLDSAADLALILDDEGRFADAEKQSRETLDIASRAYGPEDETARIARQHLAIDLAYEGKYADAEKVFREIYDVDRKSLGDGDPKVLGELNNIGSILLQQEKYPEAEKAYRDCIAIQVRVLGPDHPRTLMTMGNLAQVLGSEKRYPEAETLLRDVLAAKLKTLGPDNRSTLVTKGNLAEALAYEGKNAEAEQTIRETFESERRTLGPDHTDTLVTMNDLGLILKNEKRYPEAEKIYRDALDGRRRALGDDHPDTAGGAYDLAEVQALEGKGDEAFASLEFVFSHHPKADIPQGLARDDDLKSLHGDARFAAVMAKAHQLADAAQK